MRERVNKSISYFVAHISMVEHWVHSRHFAGDDSHFSDDIISTVQEIQRCLRVWAAEECSGAGATMCLACVHGSCTYVSCKRRNFKNKETPPTRHLETTSQADRHDEKEV